MESTYWNVRYIIVGQITKTVMKRFYKIVNYNDKLQGLEDRD